MQASGISRIQACPVPMDGMRLASGVAAGLTLAGISLIVAMLLAFALPLFTADSAGTPFSWIWQPSQGAFGILPMLAGSVLLAGGALLLGWPLGCLLCIWLLCGEERGPWRPLFWLTRVTLRLMTAIPTVVYGFAAVFLITPWIRRGLGGSGLGWVAATLMLILLILPTVVLVLEAGLGPRLARLCPGGLALGLTRQELLCFFVLPQARGTLISAAVLGFGRAVGDTLIPLMLAGNAPQIPQQWTDSLRTLTAHMALVTANEVGGAAYNSLFVAGLLLLAINGVTTVALRRLGGP